MVRNQIRLAWLGISSEIRCAVRAIMLRPWGAAILACVLLASAPAAANTLPKALDLATEAAAAAAAGKAYLVFFSETGCPWCERARREYLLPLGQDEARAKVVLRQVDVDSDAPLKDFAGRTVSHRSFARAQGVRLYPTVAFYSPEGRLAAERLTGFTNPDYYGYSIERRIDTARAALRAK